jgi:hypothetical protein
LDAKIDNSPPNIEALKNEVLNILLPGENILSAIRRLGNIGNVM